MALCVNLFQALQCYNKMSRVLAYVLYDHFPKCHISDINLKILDGIGHFGLS